MGETDSKVSGLYPLTPVLAPSPKDSEWEAGIPHFSRVENVQ